VPERIGRRIVVDIQGFQNAVSGPMDNGPDAAELFWFSRSRVFLQAGILWDFEDRRDVQL